MSTTRQMKIRSTTLISSAKIVTKKLFIKKGLRMTTILYSIVLKNNNFKYYKHYFKCYIKRKAKKTKLFKKFNIKDYYIKELLIN